MAKRQTEVTIHIHDEILSDGQRVYVAECLELGIASQGVTIEEAKQNVTEALELWLDTASPKEIDNYRNLLQREASEQFTTRIEVPYGETAGSVGR